MKIEVTLSREEEIKTDPTEREKLEKRLARVTEQIAEEEATQSRIETILSAKRKIEGMVLNSLTPEERALVDGMYLFFHGGCVDIIRSIPSSTDKGQGQRFIKTLSKAEEAEKAKG